MRWLRIEWNKYFRLKISSRNYYSTSLLELTLAHPTTAWLELDLSSIMMMRLTSALTWLNSVILMIWKTLFWTAPVIRLYHPQINYPSKVELLFYHCSMLSQNIVNKEKSQCLTMQRYNWSYPCVSFKNTSLGASIFAIKMSYLNTVQLRSVSFQYLHNYVKSLWD